MKDNVFEIICCAIIAIVSFFIHNLKTKRNPQYGELTNVGFWYYFGWIQLGSMSVYISKLIGF